MKPTWLLTMAAIFLLLGCNSENRRSKSGSPGSKDNAAPLEEYVRDLNSADVEQRRTAVRVLGASAGYVEWALPHLIESLSDKDATVRELAAKSIGKARSKAINAVNPLVARLAPHEEMPVKLACIQALSAIGPDAKDATPVLLQFLRDDDVELKKASAEALGYVSPRGDKATDEALASLLDENNPSLVLVAAEAGIRRKHDVSAALVTAVVRCMDCADPAVESTASYLLGRMGPKAEKGIPALINKLASKDEIVKELAVQAIGQIASREGESLPALAPLLKDKSLSLRIMAIQSIGEFQTKARSVVPNLIDCLGKSDEIDSAVLTALGRIGEKSDRVRSALMSMHGHPSKELRIEAARVYGKLFE
jgi:HEAT repeat protein